MTVRRLGRGVISPVEVGQITLRGKKDRAAKVEMVKHDHHIAASGLLAHH